MSFLPIHHINVQSNMRLTIQMYATWQISFVIPLMRSTDRLPDNYLAIIGAIILRHLLINAKHLRVCLKISIRPFFLIHHLFMTVTSILMQRIKIYCTTCALKYINTRMYQKQGTFKPICLSICVYKS